MASTFSRSAARHARCRLCHLVAEYPADAGHPLGWLSPDLCGDCATIYREERLLVAVRPEGSQWIIATAPGHSRIAVMDYRFATYPAAHIAQQALDAHADRHGLEAVQ